MSLSPPQLALSSAGLPLSTDPRAPIQLAQSHKLRAIALDATDPAFRPRNLSRSARRDLAATLRRAGLDLAGLDLFIPPEHLSDPVHTQRAIDAITHAAELVSELTPLVGGRSRALLSMILPESLETTTHAHLDAIAQQWGAQIVDHMPPVQASTHTLPSGIDPASDLIAGLNPIDRVHSVKALRLSDANQLGRCPVKAQGSRLRLDEYAAACMVEDHDWITLDIRGLHDPLTAVQAGIDAWDAVMRPFSG